MHRLRAALAEARQQAAAAGAEAAAAAASSSQQPASSGRVEAAMKQLDAVLPQYRAAAQALQGQAQLLKEKLAAAARERAALQDEASNSRCCCCCCCCCGMQPVGQANLELWQPCSPAVPAVPAPAPLKLKLNTLLCVSVCVHGLAALCRSAGGGASHRSTRPRLQRPPPSCTPVRLSRWWPAPKCRCVGWQCQWCCWMDVAVAFWAR